MLIESDVKTKKNGYYGITKKNFRIVKKISSTSLEEFLKYANEEYVKKFGFEYKGLRNHGKPKEFKEYYTIIHNRWSSINQRCVNGKYTKSVSAQLSPQLLAYRKKGITVDMTFDEFIDWMLENKELFYMIKAEGEIPSIDRIDSNLGYAIGNLRLIALHTNIEHRYNKECNYTNSLEREYNKEKNRLTYEKYVKNITKEMEK